MEWRPPEAEKPALILPKQGFGIEARKVGHKLVVDTAREMGFEIYDNCCSLSDEFRKRWPSPKAYVRTALPFLIPKAREVLVNYMNSTRDKAVKDKIYEALVLDNAFRNRHIR
jgi:hypothetical protein